MLESTEDGLRPDEAQIDEQAFIRLIDLHGPMLARYIRRRVPNPTDAEDVLQETLVAIWIGLPRLRDLARQHAWVMHIAQNRCYDHFRAQGRRELPLAEETLHEYANRFGLRQYRRTVFVTDVLDALEAVPTAAREAARQFYLEGLTIAEIAADTHSPLGTVKRRLFQARHAARTILGVSDPIPQTDTEKTAMTSQNTMPRQRDTAAAPPFPMIRPEIKISASDEPSFTIDCRELRAWPIIPCVGERAAAVDYFMPEWKVGEVSLLQALRPATVHGVMGVEIEARVWKPEIGWLRPGTVCARLTDDKAEYLAVHLPHEAFTQIETFLDASFTWNWGAAHREITDQGQLQCAADGSLLLFETPTRLPDMGIGFGVVVVEIADQSFTCLRVLDIPSDGILTDANDYYINVSYLTRQGRTILVRRYCRPHFADRAEFPVTVDESQPMVINGLTFLHWYDTIMDIALGPDHRLD